MKKFQFSLEILLRLRQERERIAGKELLAATLTLEEKTGLLSQAEEEFVAICRAMEKDQNRSPKINAAHIVQYESYLEAVKKKIDICRKEVQIAKKISYIKQEAVLAARRQRKILETLKEKRFLEWEQALLAKERALLDELATLKYRAP